MYVEDVFSISGRGTVATGKVERGTITKGAEVEIVGMGNSFKTTLTGIGESYLPVLRCIPKMWSLRHSSRGDSGRSWTQGNESSHHITYKPTLTIAEMFHKELDRGEAGDNMGALLRGVKREQIRRGQVLVAPGTIKSVKKFKAQIYVSLVECFFLIPRIVTEVEKHMPSDPV